jgi:hypothetical protein
MSPSPFFKKHNKFPFNISPPKKKEVFSMCRNHMKIICSRIFHGARKNIWGSKDGKKLSEPKNGIWGPFYINFT